MTITLYKIDEDRIVANKTLNNSNKIAELTAHYKEDTDILEPTLEISYNASYTSCNYIHVSDWNRYYFVKNMKAGMQRIFFECEVDVRKSYLNDIKELECIVARQEDKNKCQLYLNDGMFKAIQAKTVVPYTFPQSFDDTGSFVLTLGGES